MTNTPSPEVCKPFRDAKQAVFQAVMNLRDSDHSNFHDRCAYAVGYLLDEEIEIRRDQDVTLPQLLKSSPELWWSYRESGKAGIKLIRRLSGQINYWCFGGRGEYPLEWRQEWN